MTGVASPAMETAAAPVDELKTRQKAYHLGLAFTENPRGLRVLAGARINAPRKGGLLQRLGNGYPSLGNAGQG